jgi:hypothetical protein
MAVRLPQKRNRCLNKCSTFPLNFVLHWYDLSNLCLMETILIGVNRTIYSSNHTRESNTSLSAFPYTQTIIPKPSRVSRKHSPPPGNRRGCQTLHCLLLSTFFCLALCTCFLTALSLNRRRAPSQHDNQPKQPFKLGTFCPKITVANTQHLLRFSLCSSEPLGYAFSFLSVSRW